MKWLNLDYTLHITDLVLCCYWIRKFNCVFGYWFHLGKYSLQYNIIKWKYISSLKFYEANHQLSLKMFPPKFHLMSYFNSITFWTNNCFWHFIFWIIISHRVESCFLFQLLEQVWWRDEIIPITVLQSRSKFTLDILARVLRTFVTCVLKREVGETSRKILRSGTLF